jgi:hypothetical protein
MKQKVEHSNDLNILLKLLSELSDEEDISYNDERDS